MSTWHDGKGSGQRPTNRQRFAENYEAIFNKKATENQVELDEQSGVIMNKERELLEQVLKECGDEKNRHHISVDLYHEILNLLDQPNQDQKQEQEQEPDCVLVPRSLIGAACSAINRKQDAPKILEQLRRYTVGDLSAPQPPKQEQVAEQEPVAWVYEKPLADGFSERTLSFGFERDFDGVITPLYAHPPKRQPLSDEDVVDIARRNCGINFQYNDQIDAAIILAHEIEKAHGISDEC